MCRYFPLVPDPLQEETLEDLASAIDIQSLHANRLYEKDASK